MSPAMRVADERCYAGPLTFELYRHRFHFRSAGSLYFPPHQSGNIVRGAFGEIFRKLVCVPGCQGVATCEHRSTCAYARVFEPGAARGQGPSGLADWPRPFVFRAAHLGGRTIPSGEPFHFDVHLFDVREPSLPHFVQAFAELAREGLGPGRAHAELVSVEQVDLNGAPLREGMPPCVVDLNAAPEPVERLTVRFVSPTELKTDHGLAHRPAFAVLFGRLRDRISTLRALYGAGPLDIDFREMGERAAGVRMTGCQLTRCEVERRSSRTGQRHSLGGFVGEAAYEGALAEFVPYLRLGQWVGVGRQTVWGKGEIEVA